MDEINLRELLLYFKEKVVFFLIIVILALLIGGSYKIFLEAPKYQSSTRLILTGFSSNNNEDDSINNNDLTINQKLVSTYQEITKSRKILDSVIEELELDYTEEELASNISVSNVTDTEIITITVTDTDAKTAYKIAKKISKVFSEEVSNIYNVSNVSILDEPKIAEEPSNMSLAKSLVIYLAVGIIAGMGLIFVSFYFDTTIKTTEQLESKIDVPVLGSIPDYNKNKIKKRVKD